MPEQDLDARIRTLVARAVADAPPAPSLDEMPVRRIDPTSAGAGRRRWWVGGTAGVLAAAATIAVVVLVADREDRLTTPATSPSTTVAPTTLAVPASTVPASTVPATTAPLSSAPGTAPATTVVATPATVQQRLVTAGPDGVRVRGVTGDGDGDLIPGGPARRALPVGDGRVLIEYGNADGPSGLILWEPSGATAPLLFDGVLAGDVTVDDIAVVDGTPTLLYQVDPVDNPEPDATLYAAPIGADGIRSSAAVALGTVGAPEFGVQGLSLGANGLVVGESYSEAVAALWVAAIPGTAGAQLASGDVVARLGLDPTYDRSRCDQCPAAFTVDGSGELIAWIDAGDLVVERAADGDLVRRVPLGAAADGADDLDLLDDGVLVSSGMYGTTAPAIVRDDGSITRLEGWIADAGPGIAGAAPPPPPSPSTTTSVPAPGPTIDLVTAGSDGAAVLAADGTVLRRRPIATGSAYATPGGAVIVQERTPDGELTDPLIWRADGTADRLLGVLPTGQSYRVYDVADVGGVATVLYGVRTVPADGQPEGYREVLRALSMRPDGWVVDRLDEMNTWESGYGSLTLSSDGLVVGTVHAEVTGMLFSVVVPGSPAAASGPLTAADLGLEPSYGDCDCPTNFVVDRAGDRVAWQVGDQTIVRRVSDGTQDTWTVAVGAGVPALTAIRTAPDGTVEALGALGDGSGSAMRWALRPGRGAEVRTAGASFASFPP